MEALAAMTTRRSIRIYRQTQIPQDIIEQAIDAGRMAPTARNIQPWEFIVIKEKNRKANVANLTDHGKFISEAPVCIGVLCQDTKYYLEDGVAAVTNILNALHAQGVGACWIAGNKKPYASAIVELLQAPETMKLVALIACGYYSEESLTAPHKRELKDVLHWETF